MNNAQNPNNNTIDTHLPTSPSEPYEKTLFQNRYPMEFNNYPMPTRAETMSNRPLDSKDFPIRKFKQLDTKRDFSLNNYALDIEGAAPRSNSIFTNKKDFTLDNLDIENSSPKKSIPENVNKPNFNLSNRDIEGSLPRGHHCFVSSRHVDPLNPVYPLPSCGEKFPLEVPKFIRDTLDVRDISGAKAKIRKDSPSEYNYMDIYRRNRDDEILLSHKKLYKGNKNKLYNSLDFRDVYKIPPFSNRHTNPLEPRYVYDTKMTEVKYTSGKVEPKLYGEIEGNRPVVFSKFHNERYGKGLKTDDIIGAQPDTKSSYAKFEMKFKRPLKYSAEDIIGAHHDTLMKSMVTNRHTNPLMPDYKYLGDKGMNFDDDSRKFREKFDYSSLYDYYANHSKIAIKQRNEEKVNLKNDINENEKVQKCLSPSNNKICFDFGSDKKKYPTPKPDNIENQEKKLMGEKYLKMIQNREENNKIDNLDKNILDNFPNPADVPEFKEYNNYNNKNLGKPEVFYPIQHDEYIIPTNPNNKSGKDVSIKVLQDLQNNFENADDKKSKKNGGTYEAQLDQFISRFPAVK